MDRRSKIKAAIDTQLDVAIDVVAAARKLNDLRLQFESAGRDAEAAQLADTIKSLVHVSDRLSLSAKSASHEWLETVRAAW